MSRFDSSPDLPVDLSKKRRITRMVACLTALSGSIALAQCASNNNGTGTQSGGSGSNASGSSQGSGSASGSSASGTAESGASAGAASGTAESGASAGAASGTAESGASAGAASGTAESGASAGAPSGSASGASSGAAPTCATPTPAVGILPFAVTTKFYEADWQGDSYLDTVTGGTTTIVQENVGYTKGDTTCGGDRAVAGAVGACSKWTYAAVQQGAIVGGAAGASAQANGWASIAWDTLEPDMGYSPNYGLDPADPGFVIPAGATQVTFYAKGSQGGEMVGFGVGQIANSACNDSVIVAALTETLTPTWTKYSIPIPAGTDYSMGQIVGFLWTAACQVLPTSGDAGASDASTVCSTLTFQIDDIEWTQ